MQTSEQINEIAAALSKAQGEIQNVVKDAKNPHFKSDYATLDAITDTVRPIFAKHGLAVVQMPTFADGIVTVETMLTHTSGQWILGMPAAPLGKPDAQGVGSATTYLRRYSLAGIANIAQTDDDGNAASGTQPNGRAVESQPPAPPENYDKWWTTMVAAAEKGTPALREAFKKGTEAQREFASKHRTKALDAVKARAESVKVAEPVGA